MKKAWSNWIPAACMAPRGGPDRWAECETLRTSRWWPRRSWSIPATSCWWAKARRRFAVAMGFPRENLLTEHSRKIWMLWKEYHSTDDWWGPGLADPNWKAPDTGPQTELWDRRIAVWTNWPTTLALSRTVAHAAIREGLVPPTGTIHCSALNEKGEISGCTTTSGLAYKLPGRVRRLSDHRRGLLHRPGRGLGRRHGQRGREHQSRGSAHHRGEHAARDVSAGSGHGRVEAHRPQL